MAATDAVEASPLQPYVFRPSSFYDAQCAVRLRLNHLSQRKTQSDQPQRSKEESTAETNMANGNAFEECVVKCLDITPQSCTPLCQGGTAGKECPGQREFKRAVREAQQLLSEGGASSSDTRQWHKSIAQLHITPPDALVQSLAPHIQLSKCFADLVRVGTRRGRVVVEVVDMKYSAQAQPYHMHQVACYIEYLSTGPLQTLLRDVEWQGSIWLPRVHPGRVSGSQASLDTAPASLTFDSIKEGVWMNPIVDLEDCRVYVRSFFATTLPKAVGDGAVSTATSVDRALPGVWADMEDLGWRFSHSLCGHCRHQATCAKQRDAQVAQWRRPPNHFAVPPRVKSTNVLSERFLPCHVDPTCQEVLVWDKYFVLALTDTRSGTATLAKIDPAATLEEHRAWLHTVTVYILLAEEPHPPRAFDLGQDECQRDLVDFLSLRADGKYSCLVMDSSVRQSLLWILFLLPESAPKPVWRAYWLDSPEAPLLSVSALCFGETKRYNEVPSLVASRVFALNEMFEEVVALPWRGSPITVHTLRSLCGLQQDDTVASWADTIGHAAKFLLAFLNRRPGGDNEPVPWRPRPSPIAYTEPCTLPSHVTAQSPTRLAIKSLVTMLIVFNGRKQETDLYNEVLGVGLVMTVDAQSSAENGGWMCRPAKGQSAEQVAEQLRRLIMFAERVQPLTETPKARKAGSCPTYRLQALCSDQRQLMIRGNTKQPVLSVGRAVLQRYLEAVQSVATEGVQHHLPALECQGSPPASTEPIVLLPVVNESTTCVCYSILQRFLAHSVWQSPDEALVIEPYMRGDWPSSVENVLKGTRSQLLVQSNPAHLTSEQRQAVENVYHGGSLTMIWGPPGTGKTATVARIIVDMFASVSTGLRVLVVATTNQALEVLHKKIEGVRREVHVAEPFRDFLLVGDAASGWVPPDEKRVLVLCTIFKAFTRLVKNSCDPFDVLIVDEASMMPAAHLALAGQLLRPHTHKIILAGDLLQLQPIQQDYGSRPLLALTYPALRHWMGSSLQALFGPPNNPDRQLTSLHQLNDLRTDTLPSHVVQLNTCFRSLGKIVNLFADLYPSHLRCGRVGDEATGGRVEYVMVKSEENEVVTVMRLLKAENDPNHTALVVTPHRRQRHDLNRALAVAQADDDAFADRVAVDTTERTQGSEADCVILCYGPAVRVDTDFAYQLFRMNVALSRAVRRVVLVLDAAKVKLLRGCPDGVTPFMSAVSQGQDVSLAMATRGWQLLKRTFTSATELDA